MKFAPQLGNSQGYGQAIVGGGVNSDHVERFYMNSYPINTRQPHLLPKLPPSLRESLEAYLEELEKLAISLLGCLAKTLKIDREDGVWIPVEFIPNAFVVNIGDILEIWSNGVYKSPEHKVTVNEHTRRISIGVFFMPKQEAK
ncbi:hypothetical protein MTR67_038316 [Solanum verrucosum]|uniref:Isopenicillin N synthase-like Fe(2+) 2OG dioxygenase domain-containing protein n=1 Tax=Solanum verrucosum TaxID=315347 RepID=A0AAF0UG27_SOLVR|nr:hypothetical protein MTR67_038316 [Solanum verrucosum]